MLQGGNRPAPIKPATFLRELPYRTVKLGISLLHRHRAISWYAFGVACSPVEFQGCRVGLKFDSLLRLDAVLCGVSKQTIKPSVVYVAKSAWSQIGGWRISFLRGMLLTVVWGRPMVLQNRVNWGNGLQSVALTIKLSLKCLIFQPNEESFTSDIF